MLKSKKFILFKLKTTKKLVKYKNKKLKRTKIFNGIFFNKINLVLKFYKKKKLENNILFYNFILICI